MPAPRPVVKKVVKLLRAWAVLVDLLVVVAAIAVLLNPDATWTVIVLAVPLLVMMWRTRRSLTRRLKSVGGLGEYLIGRYLLLIVGIVQAAHHGIPTALWTVAGILLALALEAERFELRMHRRIRPYAAHLPDRDTEHRPRFAYGYLYSLGVLGLVLLVLAPVIGTAGAWALLVVAVLAVLVALAALVDIVRRIARRSSTLREMPEIVEQLEPRFFVYWSAQRGSAFQITMWLPHLERLGVPFAIIVRSDANFRDLEGVVDAPLILRRTLADLDSVIVPSARATFYVNNAVLNNHMIRYSELLHIQLLHGESDKAASSNPVTRMFDRDYVAGQAAIDRFAARGIFMPDSIFRIVGRPQVEDVEEARGPIGGIEAPTVLYAPTWQGFHQDAQYSSLLQGPDLVRRLLGRGCTVVFRPHPYSYRTQALRDACEQIKALLVADGESTGRPHLHGFAAEKEMTVFDCFNASDAMISDVSSVVGDYLHSEKPMAMISMHATADEFRREFPTSRAAYVIEGADGGLIDIDGVLDTMLGPDPMSQVRKDFATYYLGDIPRDSYAERFLAVAREDLGITVQGGSDVVSGPGAP
ncbi:CDP-glycerol glycerophosphotransferase family protein [Brachybacterium subflavum]|uniref:CDP-glycerol glycerophosphotransferase family protein n=1 Tax=Brachybacterium subflavum TaxID=2585206 RepID=UPI00126679B4|nr:CDP-glycerol glycerophosphotransferase family protein [Brachybacterium subflavum]